MANRAVESILANVQTSGGEYVFVDVHGTPAPLANTNYEPVFNVKAQDGTDVDGTTYIKAVDKITFYPPENGVMITFHLIGAVDTAPTLYTSATELITLAEVRALLGIPTADTSRDMLISTLIPLVERRIVAYCNNSFLSLSVQVYGTTIAFVSGSPATITDSDSGFVAAGFKAGNDVKIGGSASNDGMYNVATVAAGVLTLASGETLIDEEAGELLSVTRVKWPKSLKLDAANIINHYLTTQGRFAKSETLPGGYQVTYKDDPEVWRCLNQYRKPYQ